MAADQTFEPPKLRIGPDGRPDIGSLADVLEWFLNYDEKTARMRHADTDEVFRWKQQEDKVSGLNVFPFESAEARFALGAIQAVGTNPSEDELRDWIGELLAALQESRAIRTELSDAYGLNGVLDLSTIERSQKLPTASEKKIYLTSCWMETLCTAEVRFLGWIFQELYGKPYA